MTDTAVPVTNEQANQRAAILPLAIHILEYLMDIFAISLVFTCFFCLGICGAILAEGWRANRRFRRCQEQREIWR